MGEKIERGTTLGREMKAHQTTAQCTNCSGVAHQTNGNPNLLSSAANGFTRNVLNLPRRLYEVTRRRTKPAGRPSDWNGNQTQYHAVR